MSRRLYAACRRIVLRLRIALARHRITWIDAEVTMLTDTQRNHIPQLLEEYEQRIADRRAELQLLQAELAASRMAP